ncbi:MAG: hypothetical protein R3C15_19835 [Thermoleophilia bacterium]
MEIGKPKREYTVEPIVDPVPREDPVPERRPEQEPVEPELAPA